MRLVALARADAARLAALHAASFDRPWSAAEFESLLDSPGVAALAATQEDGGALAAFVLIRAAAGEAEILTLAAAPEHRRLGLGRALVEAAAGAAWAVGAEVLWLEVADDNAAALALYQSAGFAVAGRRPNYYARGAGLAAVDAVVMRRALNSGAG